MEQTAETRIKGTPMEHTVLVQDEGMHIEHNQVEHTEEEETVLECRGLLSFASVNDDLLKCISELESTLSAFGLGVELTYRTGEPMKFRFTEDPNVTIHVKGAKFAVHKHVMSKKSSLFESKLEKKYDEKKVEMHMELPNPESFPVIIKYSYGFKLADSEILGDFEADSYEFFLGLVKNSYYLQIESLKNELVENSTEFADELSNSKFFSPSYVDLQFVQDLLESMKNQNLLPIEILTVFIRWCSRISKDLSDEQLSTLLDNVAPVWVNLTEMSNLSDEELQILINESSEIGWARINCRQMINRLVLSKERLKKELEDHRDELRTLKAHHKKVICKKCKQVFHKSAANVVPCLVHTEEYIQDTHSRTGISWPCCGGEGYHAKPCGISGGLKYDHELSFYY